MYGIVDALSPLSVIPAIPAIEVPSPSAGFVAGGVVEAGIGIDMSIPCEGMGINDCVDDGEPLLVPWADDVGAASTAVADNGMMIAARASDLPTRRIRCMLMEILRSRTHGERGEACPAMPCRPLKNP